MKVNQQTHHRTKPLVFELRFSFKKTVHKINFREENFDLLLLCVLVRYCNRGFRNMQASVFLSALKPIRNTSVFRHSIAHSSIFQWPSARTSPRNTVPLRRSFLSTPPTDNKTQQKQVKSDEKKEKKEEKGLSWLSLDRIVYEIC